MYDAYLQRYYSDLRERAWLLTNLILPLCELCICRILFFVLRHLHLNNQVEL